MPWQAGWLAGLTSIAIMTAAGAIDAKSLIVIWPVMSAISVVLYYLFGYWSDTGNFLIFVMLVLVPPFGIGEVAYDLAEDKHGVPDLYGRRNPGW